MNKTLKRELDVALHGQSLRFRTIKYAFLFSISAVIYAHFGWPGVGLFLLVGAVAGIALHMFFRWKTRAWTRSWGLYQPTKKRSKRNTLTLIALGTLALCAIVASLMYVGYRREENHRILLESTITQLSPKLGGYPPRIEGETEKKQVVEQWQQGIDVGEILIKEVSTENKAYAYWKTGELYKMGHNLDIPGAWEKAESYLMRAIEKDATLIGPRIALGMLYVNTSPTYAPDAESIFKDALPLVKKPEDLRRIYDGALFALYYQGKLDVAANVVEKGLEMFPDDKGLLDFKALLEAVRKN